MKTTKQTSKTKKTLKINVSKKDIETGEPEDSSACPIALALEKAGLVDVFVDISALSFRRDYDSPEYEMTMPKLASEFVADFDAGEPVNPIKFSINPKKLRRTGY